MQKNPNNYPTKDDYEPRVFHPKKGVIRTEELPLADPADSNSDEIFRINEHSEDGKHQPSAYSENKLESSGSPLATTHQPISTLKEYNDNAHEKWNEHKRKQ